MLKIIVVVAAAADGSLSFGLVGGLVAGLGALGITHATTKKRHGTTS